MQWTDFVLAAVLALVFIVPGTSEDAPPAPPAGGDVLDIAYDDYRAGLAGMLDQFAEEDLSDTKVNTIWLKAEAQLHDKSFRPVATIIADTNLKQDPAGMRGLAEQVRNGELSE